MGSGKGKWGSAVQTAGPGAGERGMSSWSGRPHCRRLPLNMKAEAGLCLMRGEVEPPRGTPSGTFIRRWNSISRGRASACLGSDAFNLEPYENRRPRWPGRFLSNRENQHHRGPVGKNLFIYSFIWVWHHLWSLHHPGYYRPSEVILQNSGHKNHLWKGYYSWNV